MHITGGGARQEVFSRGGTFWKDDPFFLVRRFTDFQELILKGAPSLSFFCSWGSGYYYGPWVAKVYAMPLLIPLCMYWVFCHILITSSVVELIKQSGKCV